MAPSPWWRGRRLVWVLLALGVALPLFDLWRWWTSRHPVDRGSYAERADWSAPAREGVHLSAFAYRDRNRDGRLDLGDLPMAGIAFAVSGEGGVDALARTNLAGFANFDMSASDRSADLRRPGAYLFRVLVPPRWSVTSGNPEQQTRLESLPGSPADLISANPPSPVGLAPGLELSGRLAQRTPSGGVEPPRGATLTALDPTGATHSVALGADGAFAVSASAGIWHLVARGSGGEEIRRDVAVRDAPVHVAGLVLGGDSPAPRGAVERIDFENVTGGSLAKIPNGFAGLDWNYLNAVAAETTEIEGYANALTSGRFVAYASSGHPVTLSRAGGFDFFGVYVTVASPRAEGEILHLQVFRGAALVSEEDVKLSYLGPVWIDADDRQVDRIVLASRHAWQFALDDLEITLGKPGAEK